MTIRGVLGTKAVSRPWGRVFSAFRGSAMKGQPRGVGKPFTHCFRMTEHGDTDLRTRLCCRKQRLGADRWRVA